MGTTKGGSIAVTSVGEAPNSPRGSQDKDKISFEREFTVITDNYGDGPLIVMLAVQGIDDYMSQYAFGNEIFPLANLIHADAKRKLDNSLAWTVIVKYETPGEDEKNQHKDPTLDIPTVSFSAENYQIAAVASDDEDEQPISNSAGEAYTPQPQQDEARTLITIKRNEPITAGHPEIARTYVNCVNSDFFWGWAPRQVKCQNVATELKMRSLTDGQFLVYLDVTYSFSCAPRTWDVILLDQGNFHLQGGNQVAFKTADGHPYVGLLNGVNGTASGTVPHYLPPIQVYQAIPFAPLNLPQSYLEVVPVPTGAK